MSSALVRIWTVRSEPEADIVISLLDSHGIESVSEGEISLIESPFSGDESPQIDILVREEDTERALIIIEEHLDAGQ